LEGAVSSVGGFGSASDNRRGKKNSEWMYSDELHWIKQQSFSDSALRRFPKNCRS